MIEYEYISPLEHILVIFNILVDVLNVFLLVSVPFLKLVSDVLHVGDEVVISVRVDTVYYLLCYLFVGCFVYAESIFDHGGAQGLLVEGPNLDVGGVSHDAHQTLGEM